MNAWNNIASRWFTKHSFRVKPSYVQTVNLTADERAASVHAVQDSLGGTGIIRCN